MEKPFNNILHKQQSNKKKKRIEIDFLSDESDNDNLKTPKPFSPFEPVENTQFEVHYAKDERMEAKSDLPLKNISSKKNLEDKHLLKATAFNNFYILSRALSNLVSYKMKRKDKYAK